MSEEYKVTAEELQQHKEAFLSQREEVRANKPNMTPEQAEIERAHDLEIIRKYEMGEENSRETVGHELDRNDFYHEGYGMSYAEFEAEAAQGREPSPVLQMDDVLLRNAEQQQQQTGQQLDHEGNAIIQNDNDISR